MCGVILNGFLSQNNSYDFYMLLIEDGRQDEETHPHTWMY